MDTIFIKKEPKIDLDQIQLSEATKKKFEKILEEQEKGHILREQGLKPRYRLLFHGAAGTGKAQPLYSKIATPKGWVTMGNLSKGDEVITPQGKITKIKETYPQNKKKQVFLIETTDGRQTECCKEHLWKIINKKEKEEIITTAKLKKKIKKEIVYIPTPIIHKAINSKSIISIPHKLLGEILYRINNKTAKEVLLNETNNIDKKTINKYLEELQKLNLDKTTEKTKFIPKEYIKGNKQQREELLEGLGISKNESKAIYNTTSLPLAAGIREISWSLGYTCKINLEKGDGEDYSIEKYSIRISKDNKVKIKNIRKLNKKTEMKCISLEDEDQLYITDDYIVTHNTLGAEAIAYHLNKILYVFNLESISGTDPDEAMKTVMDGFRFINTSSDVFLFDEFDAIANSRNADSSNNASRRTSNALLIAFESIKSPAILICATNFISTVDPAFRRRFDTICKFELPTIDERTTIIKNTLEKYEMHASEDDIFQAAKGTEGLSYHEAEELAICATKTALLKKTKAVNLIAEIPGTLERRNTFKKAEE